MFHFIYLGALVIISLKIVFVMANSVDHDNMLDYVAFHLGLHCLQKDAFRSHQNRKISQKFENIFKILLHVRYKYFYCGQYTCICFSPEDDTLELNSKSFTLHPQHRYILSFQVHAPEKIMQYKAEDS